MQVDGSQLQRLSHGTLKTRIAQALARGAPGFSALAASERSAFVDHAIGEAQGWGFRTSQGFAAYALALWFLEPGFPETSRYLQALLASRVPEVRKVHAMNEWVSTLLGRPEAMAAADEKLKQAFYSTQAWGLAA